MTWMGEKRGKGTGRTKKGEEKEDQRRREGERKRGTRKGWRTGRGREREEASRV